MLATDRITPYRAYTPRTVTLPDGKERAVPDKLSLKEFESFPWPEGERWELIWGVPVMTPSPQPDHQRILFKLGVLLENLLKSQPDHEVLLGVDVQLPGTESYICPDVFSIAKADAQGERPFRATPLLVVEILSPSTSGNDLGAKRELYARAGVTEYWVVDPRNGSLIVHVNPKDGVYSDLQADPDGFTPSPYLGKKLRIRHLDHGYEIDLAD